MLTLSNEEISELDKQIQEMPFKYAFPIFNFLKTKITNQANREAAAQEQLQAVENTKSLEEAKPKLKVK